MKHDRFRNLEDKAPPATESAEPASPKLSGRFAAVASPKQDAKIQIDPRDARGERAHIRCIECGHENGTYADSCEKCQATLLSRAVRRLNVRLHQDEQAAGATHVVTSAADVEPEGSEPVIQITGPQALLDHVAHKLGFKSPMLGRAVVVGAISSVFGVLYLATGSRALGFLFSLIVTLGLVLVVIQDRSASR